MGQESRQSLTGSIAQYCDQGIWQAAFFMCSSGSSSKLIHIIDRVHFLTVTESLPLSIGSSLLTSSEETLCCKFLIPGEVYALFQRFCLIKSGLLWIISFDKHSQLIRNLNHICSIPLHWWECHLIIFTSPLHPWEEEIIRRHGSLGVSHLKILPASLASLWKLLHLLASKSRSS